MMYQHTINSPSRFNSLDPLLEGNNGQTHASRHTCLAELRPEGSETPLTSAKMRTAHSEASQRSQSAAQSSVWLGKLLLSPGKTCSLVLATACTGQDPHSSLGKADHYFSLGRPAVLQRLQCVFQ